MREKTNEELLDMFDPELVEMADTIIWIEEVVKHKNTYDFLFNSVCKGDPSREEDFMRHPYLPDNIALACDLYIATAKEIYSISPNDFEKELQKTLLKKFQLSSKYSAATLEFYSKDGNIEKLTDAIIKDMHIDNGTEEGDERK